MLRLAALIVMLVLAESGAHAADKAIAPLWVGPAYSGSWFTPERSGEGFILEVLDNGTALLLWFTYPPAGSAARQAWIYADGGAIEGERIRFASAVTTRGGRFGPGSGTAPAQRIAWGSVEFRFTSCNEGEVTYSGPAGWGSATRRIARLTEIAETGCGAKRRVAASGARGIDGLRQRSAAWLNPANDADGWAIEEIGDGRALVYWFTYDRSGEQMWTYGEATVEGDRLVVASNRRPTGTRFGEGFDASRVVLDPWGSLDLAFNGCDRASLSYAALDAAFGSGTLAPARLTRLAGTACLGEKPVVPANGAWSAGATMPSRQSEVATATFGARACTAGGFPAQRDFQCYDMAANTWSVLPSLPAGRDHGEAIAYEGAMYFTGGNGEDGDANGWRYDFALASWQAVPQLPNVASSAATMLDGFAYFGGLSSIFQYNPRTRQTRQIPGDGRAARDHSQLVAFQGEIWYIGGRGGTGVLNGVVSIYDPASETWRPGPGLRTPRSGFAAAASATTLFVAGGERLEAPAAAIAGAEAIAAGDSAWTALPPLPIAVHGVGAAVYGNAFFTLGGSRVPGTAVNFGDVQVYRFTP